MTSTPSRSQKEELYRLLMTKKTILDRDRLVNFIPNKGFQENFFKSGKSIRLALSGNQSGKTHVGAVESSMLSLGIHPHKKLERIPNTGVVVSAQGFKEGIEKTIMPKFLSVVGTNDIRRIKKNSQGIPTKILWSNGSVTHLMSAEQDDDVFEGTTLDYFWIDEPVRRDIFVALKRGMLTTNGLCWFTCTPLSEPWIYEELYMPALSGDQYIQCFEGSSDENHRISKEARDEFKALLTEDELDARWHGKFRHLSGRVFKTYDPDKHLIKSFDIPKTWPVYVAIDPHRNKPHAVIFMAISPTGKKYICNEIYIKCGMERLADYIHEIGAQYNIVQKLIDTSAQEDGWEKESAREILQRCGVRTKLAQKKNLKKSGILLINQAFENNDLFIMEHCKRTHREFINNIFKRNKSDAQIVLDEPEKKFDDCIDCIRYIFVERPYYRQKSKIQEIGPLYQKVRKHHGRLQRSEFS